VCVAAFSLWIPLRVSSDSFINFGPLGSGAYGPLALIAFGSTCAAILLLVLYFHGSVLKEMVPSIAAFVVVVASVFAPWFQDATHLAFQGLFGFSAPIVILFILVASATIATIVVLFVQRVNEAEAPTPEPEPEPGSST